MGVEVGIQGQREVWRRECVAGGSPCEAGFFVFVSVRLLWQGKRSVTFLMWCLENREQSVNVSVLSPHFPPLVFSSVFYSGNIFSCNVHLQHQVLCSSAPTA